jgi:hypothetical protein
MSVRPADLPVDSRPGSGALSVDWRSEELWRLGATDGATLRLVDRFEAAPQRILSVYRRVP